MKWHRVIWDAKHRPMRNSSEQVLKNYILRNQSAHADWG
jgi:hypothetical protein